MPGSALTLEKLRSVEERVHLLVSLVAHGHFVMFAALPEPVTHSNRSASKDCHNAGPK